MYHDVCAAATSNDRYTLPQSTFREHLSLLRERQFEVGDLSILASSSAGQRAVLTFDDGLASHYERVFPALLDSGFSGIFFTTTALVNTPGYLTWSQIREMSDAGMTFGSHGQYHIDHSGMGVSLACRQLRCSRFALEDALGKPVSSFSAPYGFLNHAVVEAAQLAGFQWTCSSTPWPASARASVVSRLAIYRDTDVPHFSALASGNAIPLLTRFARNALLHLPKRLLLRTWPGRLGVNVQGELK
jgi:peptidoglycan/xylan/chitin deacetylase (PgdA/CDA1 family)